jgi:hypothetical protein
MAAPVVNPYDGPALVDWIETRPEARYLDDGLRRHLRHWRSGHNPGEQAVDAFLCRLRIHLSEVPPHIALGWPEGAVRGLDLDYEADGSRVLRRAA